MFDFAKYRDLKSSSIRFVLSPTLWTQLTSTLSLVWNDVPFGPSMQGQVPDVRGVYAFVLGMPRTDVPQFGYPMYVGETGNRSAATLRRRFGDYLQEKAQQKRTKFYVFLNEWDGWIRFAYATVPDKRRNLVKIEEHLNRALIPPLVRDDFPADILPEITAFRALS